MIQLLPMTAFSLDVLGLSPHWQIAGWTMLHFLWLGTLVAAVGILARTATRRINPTIRYAQSLAVFAVLALLPVGIAAWISANSPAFSPSTALLSDASTVASEQFTAADWEQANTQAAPPAKTPSDTQPVTTDGAERAPFAASSAPTPGTPVAPLAAGDVVQGAPAAGPPGGAGGFQLGIDTRTARRLPAVAVGGRYPRSPSPSWRPVWSALSVFATEADCWTAASPSTAAPGFARHYESAAAWGVAVCERLARPVLVGIVRPLILLPPAALTGWSPDDLEMVLLHELAHVRRWDNLINLINLVQRVVESLLFFHPAVWLVSRWVRHDREQCCDAVVVAHTSAPQAYAELLVTIAAAGQPTASPTLASAMADHPLAHRIRRILRIEEQPMRVSRGTLGIAGLALVAMLAVVLWLPLQRSSAEPPAPAEETTPAPAETEEKATEDTESTEENGSASEPDLSNPFPFGDPAEGPNRSTPAQFPSLEDQKRADLAYKMLGLELEPLSSDELARVKALGYEGGLCVSPYSPLQDQPFYPMRNELLVGLHVWPTRSLQDVEKILRRDDIAELSPLKFYVVRGGGTLATGRIDVAPAPQPESTETKPAATGEKPDYLYDGKTFDQWRSQWKTELKVERRIEAIRALAAFGTHGYGKEAVEAIFDVAEQYDFHMFGGDEPEGKLKQEIINQLTFGSATRIAEAIWLPVLQERLKKEPAKYKWLAESLLGGLHYPSKDPSVVQRLDELTRNADADIRHAAYAALWNTDPDRKDPLVVESFRRALTSDNVNDVKLALRGLTFKYLYASVGGGMGGGMGGGTPSPNLYYMPEILPILFHKDESVRRAARGAITRISDTDAPKVVEPLIEIIEDPKQAEKHLAAVRALAALGPRAKAAEPILLKLIQHEDKQLAIAAALSKDKIFTHKDILATQGFQSFVKRIYKETQDENLRDQNPTEEDQKLVDTSEEVLKLMKKCREMYQQEEAALYPIRSPTERHGSEFF